MTISVAGAGLAGLVAAARLRELGRDVVVREKGSRLGGSMLLSSGVVFRHRSFDDFRAECPGGDERLQRLVWERLDEAVEWLVARGAPVVWQETGNPHTVGKRFEPRGIVEALAGEVALAADGCVGEPLVLCTGGFAASSELVARFVRPAGPLRLRASPWSTGDGLSFALARGAALSAGMGEFYGRNMPDAPWDETQLVSLSQLYGRFARIYDEDGVEFFARGDVSWSETNVVQATARRPGANAFYVLDEDALARRVRERTVAEMVAAAPSEAHVSLADLPFDPPDGAVAAVRVVASITHTIGGLRIDDRARVLREDGSPVDGLWAAGVDAGGVATGGYASGLAQALVLGLVAAEDAAR
ncbi:MAG TPA: FAD-dependent oxidoreductase [Gaiellaceae bacterium]|nr:FAD-dependent oxidoreductase [Gaiellaceae bacterium]